MPTYISGPLGEYPAFFAHSPVLLVEALQTAIDRLPRAAQAFASLLGCGAFPKKGKQSRLFAQRQRPRSCSVIRHRLPYRLHAVFSARAV